MYNEYILPHLISCACSLESIKIQREKIVPWASGKVLEIGMGAGLNLEYYDRNRVDKIWGLEPSEGMRKKAKPVIDASGLNVEWLGLGSEQIPLQDNSVDTIVMTYTLCSIADGSTALAEMRRVLKPEGMLLFSEHGRAPDDNIRKWQSRINPFWKVLFGGCHLNKPIPEMFCAAKFEIQELDEMYIPGPKIAAYNYCGMATI